MCASVQKTPKCPKVPPARGDGHCHFFVAKKGRYCPLMARSDSKYCREHMVGKTSDNDSCTQRVRVPCPYDPSHSVDLHALKKHMATLCNARPPETWPAYVAPDCNIALLPPGYAHGSFDESGALWKGEGLAKADPRLMLKPGDLMYMSAAPHVFSEETPSSAGGSQKHGRQALGRQAVEGLLKPVVLSYLRSVEELFASAGAASRAGDATQYSLGQLLEQVRCSEEFPTDECVHSALDQKLMAKTNQKHAQQQASIIGHLERRGLLDPKYAFVEFGAGKGELSVYVHAAISAKNADGAPESCFSENCFYLVDRKTFRQKFKIDQQGKCGDRKTRDGQGVRHRFERISIDIRDLDLASLDGLRIIDPQTGNAALRPIVAYSKHLCGGATDLTLKCLERYQQSGGSIAGIAIALCCHHACRYSMYVDHEYLSTAIPSFSAASGQWSGEQHDSFKSLVAMTSWAIDSPSSSSPDDASETGPEQQAHYSGLSYAQRRRAGHAVKRFLDIGRLWYVRRWLGMDDAELVYYTSHMASPENLALLATKMEV